MPFCSILIIVLNCDLYQIILIITSKETNHPSTLQVVIRTQQRYKGAMNRVLREKMVKNDYVRKQKELRDMVHNMELLRKEQV